METKPFIPRDKPKSWVVFVLSGLIGLAFGLCAFASASQGWLTAKTIFSVGFILCWAIGAAAVITCAHGMLTGRYGNIQDRPWEDQVW